MFASLLLSFQTTIAAVFAQILHDLGLLPSNKCLVASPGGRSGSRPLVSHYEGGQTSSLVAQVLEDACGGVLFIDEAYELAGESLNYKAAASALLDMNNEKYKKNLVVVVAGYEQHILQFFSSNSGLASRFHDALVFKAWTPEQCLASLRSKFQKDEDLIIPDDLNRLLLDYFTQLSSLDAFASARDVYEVIYKQMSTKWKAAFDFTPSGSLCEPPPMSEDIIRHVFDAVIAERRKLTAVHAPHHALHARSAGSRSSQPPMQHHHQQPHHAITNIVKHLVEHVHNPVREEVASVACDHELGATAEQLRMVEEARQFEMQVETALRIPIFFQFASFLFALGVHFLNPFNRSGALMKNR